MPMGSEDQWVPEPTLVPTLSHLPGPSGLGRGLQVPHKCLKGVLCRA